MPSEKHRLSPNTCHLSPGPPGSLSCLAGLVKSWLDFLRLDRSSHIEVQRSHRHTLKKKKAKPKNLLFWMWTPRALHKPRQTLVFLTWWHPRAPSVHPLEVRVPLQRSPGVCWGPLLCRCKYPGMKGNAGQGNNSELPQLIARRPRNAGHSPARVCRATPGVSRQTFQPANKRIKKSAGLVRLQEKVLLFKNRHFCLFIYFFNF